MSLILPYNVHFLDFEDSDTFSARWDILVSPPNSNVDYVISYGVRM